MHESWHNQKSRLGESCLVDHCSSSRHPFSIIGIAGRTPIFRRCFKDDLRHVLKIRNTLVARPEEDSEASYRSTVLNNSVQGFQWSDRVNPCHLSFGSRHRMLWCFFFFFFFVLYYFSPTVDAGHFPSVERSSWFNGLYSPVDTCICRDRMHLLANSAWRH